MEDQYKALLQNIVSSGSMNDPATGKPWLPSQNFFDVVEKQFQSLKDELTAEKTANEGILSDAHTAVVACNTARNTRFTEANGIVALQGTMQTARGTHSTCRHDEDGKIDDMESKCAAFDNLASKCDENQDWYAQYNDGSVVAEAANTLQEVVSKATACKGAVDVTTTTANQCDGDQTAFKGAFCTYEKELSKECEKHHACYVLQTNNLEASTKSVKALEIEQKTIWRMVGKVDCYLRVLMGAGVNSMPTQADIATCSAKVIDDTELDITYTAPQPEDKCMDNAALNGDLASPTNRPGAGSWFTTEMAGLTAHNKLNDDAPCAHR
jgi:hypothetical protein